MTAPAGKVGFGLLVPTLMEFEPCGLDRLREAARLGDEHDFDVLWVGDHLMFSAPILDATVSVAVLGAMTTRVSVGTNVLQLPLRRPVDVAKSFATISHLTGGRLILGIGVGGHFELEWAAAGVSPRERGARCDEAIDALGWYWSGTQADGKYAHSPGLAINPPPVDGRVPIWVGGRAGAAVRRAARCDGSLNIWVSPQRCAQIREEIRELRGGRLDEFTFGLELLAHVDDDADRARRDTRDAISRLHLDPDALEKYTAFGPPAAVAERVLEYMAAGVQHVSFYLPGVGWSEQARRIAEDVIPRVRASLPSVPELQTVES
jgi:alkanesulfonate monooxygenase SsuD/methylene tetrahydromethanopterin reductase-like flavin-dependent oxidoreductase (luciferase family)